MRSVFWPALAGACVLLWCARDASAQESGEPLRLAEAIKRALAQQPELAAFAFELRAQEARVTEAGLPPVTQAEVLVEDAAGTGDHRGFDAAQTTLSLSHVLELGGKRQGRIAVAEAARTQLHTAQAARQLDITAEVARRFIESLHKQARLQLAAEGQRLARETREAVERRTRAALAPAAEIARAEVQVTQAWLEHEHAEHELQSSRRFLAAAMGERDVRFADTAGNLFAFETVAPLEELIRRAEQSPDFLQFADEARVYDAQLRLAELQRRPDLRGQLGLRRYEHDDSFGIVAGFSIPLQSARRAQSAMDVARAARGRTDAQREAALLKVHAQLFAQYRELEHVMLEARVLRETVVPQLEGALEKTGYAYRRGRYSYLEWADAQRQLLEARGRLIDVAANFHLLRVEIERLTGQSLESIGATP